MVSKTGVRSKILVVDDEPEAVELVGFNLEQAGFAVLKAPDVPSILVETAFISNPEEEKRLNDEIYQDQLARAILGGIKRYFARHPPRPSPIAIR